MARLSAMPSSMDSNACNRHCRSVLELDHLTVIAPTLAEGVAHVRECLDLDVPFGQRHAYMGTHNHLLQLGGSTYLEIVALDPEAPPPECLRWFGLDDPAQVRRDWDDGRRFRGWVARTGDIDRLLAEYGATFGRKVSLPRSDPSFDFAIPDDGSLPLAGALPSIIDRRGKPRSMAAIADLGAQLVTFSLDHPDADAVTLLLRDLEVDRPPIVTHARALRYRAQIMTPAGLKELS